MIGRRAFLGRGGAIAASALAGGCRLPGAGGLRGAVRHCGVPALQSPGADFVTVAWSLPEPSFAAVELFADASLASPSGVFFPPCDKGWADSGVVHVRLEGLVPGRRYWYRTIAAPVVRYANAWDYEIGAEAVSRAYSFVMPGASSHFAVVNDTHGFPRAVGEVFAKVAELAPSLVLWNGDAVGAVESEDDARRFLLEPPEAPGFASGLPHVLLNGNHECRGCSSNSIDCVFAPPGGRRFPWNFALRLGDVAVVGLDTTEPTSSKVWRGGARFQRFRDGQAEWLEEALRRPDVASAPFIVPVYHVPLVPDGETRCLATWGRLFAEAGVQVAIAGHTHTPAFHAPAEGRPWAEVVGGGPIFGEFEGDRGHMDLPDMFPTVIDCDVTPNGRLAVTVHDIWRRRVFGEWFFEKRKAKA